MEAKDTLAAINAAAKGFLVTGDSFSSRIG